MQSAQGAAFNKTLVESQMNRSSSKASYGFSRAKRFNDLKVNEEGYAITMLGDSNSKQKHGSSTIAST